MYLGIDVGTSSVKLTVIDEGGRVIATASAAYPIDEPRPAWREIDPDTWWRAVREACGDLRRLVDLGAIKGVGVTGQMHTIVQVDAEGRPACRSIMWSDQRTLEDVRRVKAALAEAGEDDIALRLSTGSPAIDLAWSREHDESAFKATKTFMGVPDWIALKLGAAPGVDWCGASTSSLFDIPDVTWSSGACKVFGVPERMLPVIEDADHVAGTVGAEAASETGLPEGALIVRGTGDNPAAAIPTGCLSLGMPVISLGTSGVLMYAYDGVAMPRAGKPVLVRAGGTLKTLVQLSLRSCGSNREWWDKSILRATSFELEDERVASLEYDMRDLYFYPHLNGEKVLHQDPSIRGAFLGLDLDTTRSELCRALMEGVAFSLRSLRDAVEGASSWNAICLVGGGSKSDLWTQIIANVLDTRIIRLETSGAGQGAAMLALAASTGEGLDKVAERVVRRVDEVESAPHIARRYAERYERYARIYDALRSVYRG